MITNGKNDISLSVFRPVAFENKGLFQGAYADFLADNFHECRDKLTIIKELFQNRTEVER